jgi:Tfp pilus assembly protein PilN
MMPELTNLLSEGRVRALRRLYLLRVAVVALMLLAGVILVHGVLLLPSFLYLHTAVKEKTSVLAALTAAVDGEEQLQIRARVDTLAGDATYLGRLAQTPKASAAVFAVTKLPRPGIVLTGFSFAPGSGGGASMNVTGTATTRESLRAYEDTLKDVPFVTSVTLPISAYAKERAIDFTVTLTGPFLP